MTKKDFIDIYAEKTGESKKKAGELVEAFLEVVEASLSKGDTVQFVGGGTFEVKTTAERIGRNPKTGVETMIPSRKVVKFKVGKLLADKVNK